MRLRKRQAEDGKRETGDRRQEGDTYILNWSLSFRILWGGWGKEEENKKLTP
ncbi:MAG: hypothetical protein ABIL68_07430 [bacterium]